MSNEMHELAEHIEHAGHGGGGHGDGGKGPGKMIGVTMAILGVMLALCAALVGSHRTELIKTMVEQSNKWGHYQAETMKFRVMHADYEMLKSLTPKPDEVKKMEETLKTKRGSSGKADDEDTAELKELIASAVEDMADFVTPDPEEKEKFRKIANRYEHDMLEAKEDAEAFEPAIRAHQDAAEWYERGQLAAEIGIVIASVALMLGSRAIWLVAVAMGLICGGVVGTTWTHTHSALIAAEEHITEANKREEAIDSAEDEPGDDKPPATKGQAHAAPGGHDTKPAAEHGAPEPKPEHGGKAEHH